MRHLSDYIKLRGKLTTIRIFEDISKQRFDALQKRLTVASGGIKPTQAQIIEILLDNIEEAEKILNWKPYK